MRCSLLLLLALIGCSVTPSTTPSVPATAPHGGASPPVETRIDAILQRQIQEYEAIFYATRPADPAARDWTRTDDALRSWLPQHPEFADYYRWMAENNRRETASDEYRYPATLRANVGAYLAVLPDRRAAESARLATLAAPTQAAPPPAAGLRQPVLVRDWELTVIDWDNRGAGDVAWSATGDTLHTDGTWVVIVVALRNTSGVSRTVDPAAFQLRDAYGRLSPFPRERGAVAYSAYRGGSDLAGAVAAGGTAYFNLLFGVAPDFRTLSLVYNWDWHPVILIGDYKVAVAPTAAPTATATIAPTKVPLPTPAAAIRQPVLVRDWELTVIDWDNRGAGDVTWSATGDTLHTDARWVVIVVALTNRSPNPLAVAPTDFQVRDAAGRIYAFPNRPGAAAYSAYRGGGELGQVVAGGGTVYYNLLFEIAPDAGAFALIFNQDWRPIIAVGGS
jgi:hypothetical protein